MLFAIYQAAEETHALKDTIVRQAEILAESQEIGTRDEGDAHEEHPIEVHCRAVFAVLFPSGAVLRRGRERIVCRRVVQSLLFLSRNVKRTA